MLSKKKFVDTSRFKPEIFIPIYIGSIIESNGKVYTCRNDNHFS